jgi:hypothetical protein
VNTRGVAYGRLGCGPGRGSASGSGRPRIAITVVGAGVITRGGPGRSARARGGGDGELCCAVRSPLCLRVGSRWRGTLLAGTEIQRKYL